MKKLFLLSAVALLVMACGRTAVNPNLEPIAPVVVKTVEIEVQMSSKEQGAKYDDINAEEAQMAMGKLVEFFTSKGIQVLGESPEDSQNHAVVQLKMHIQWGSRAARYWAGMFGAGTGLANSSFVVTSQGSELVNKDAKAVLKVGAFGGSMHSVVRDQVKAIIKDIDPDFQ